MNNEFTIQEIQLMLEVTRNTSIENLRLQSLTTNEFLLNVLTQHHQDLTKDLAELQSMLENHSDFIQSVW